MNSIRSRQFANLLAVAAVVSALAVTTPAFAVDDISGFLFNNTSYSQTSNSAPTMPVGYFFSLGATFGTAGDYNSATATYPGTGSPQTLPALGTTEFNYNSTGYGSSTALQAAYPFGTYTITATGSAGTSTSNIPYAANLFANAIPYLTNFSSLNGLNSGQSFTVDYDSFTPNSGASQGFTFFTVYNATSGNVVYSDEFQNPSSTSAVIPANTLTSGTAYDYEIDFSDRLNGYDALNSTYTEQGFDLRTDGSFTTAITTAVPEPSTWALLLLGFAGVGFAAFRRTKADGMYLTAA